MSEYGDDWDWDFCSKAYDEKCDRAEKRMQEAKEADEKAKVPVQPMVYGIHYESCIEILGQLMKSVPWDTIRGEVKEPVYLNLK